MTTTDLTFRAELASSSGRVRRPGVWSWFTTVDHKKIGIMYGTHRARSSSWSAGSRRC